jgi:DNA-directed RNA polymerase omega subunit
VAYIPIENLLKEGKQSTYKIVVLAFKRALELSNGSGKLVEASPNTKLTSIAISEIRDGKITYKEKKKE